MSETPGLDWSTARPSPALVLASGFRFAMRYVSPLYSTGPNPKDVTAAELRDLRAVGLAVGLVWETTAARALDGQAAGFADGQVASARARAVGYPSDCVVFYAVDFDATADQLAAVAGYGAGFAAGVGYPSGPYGSATVVDHLADVGPAAGGYYWQTAAWSGGRVSDRAHLLQRATVRHWPVLPGTDENVLLHPLPLCGMATAAQSPTPPTSGDDMAASIIHNTDTDEMALLAPGLFWHIWSPAYIPLYVAAGLARGPAVAFHANDAQYKHLRDVALSGLQAPAGQLLDQLTAISGVDARILAAVNAAHPA